MRSLMLIGLLAGLYGCAKGGLDALHNDLAGSEIIGFSYETNGHATFECDPVAGQKMLNTWSATLREARIASWPHPDDYIELSFKNDNNYKLRVFAGTAELKYSVLYSDRVYTGELLKLESVCPGLGVHDTSPLPNAYSLTPIRRRQN